MIKRIFNRNFVAVAVGMFVFGFVDNFILVIAGEGIDQTISATFGFSTMFSAGLGNTLSDAVGVLSGSLIAKMVFNYFEEPTKEEVGEKMYLFAETAGIVLGCLLGLLPLLFL